MSYQRCQYETSQKDLERWLCFIEEKEKEKKPEDHYFATIICELSNLRRLIEAKLANRRYNPVKLQDCYLERKKETDRQPINKTTSSDGSKKLLRTILGFTPKRNKKGR